MEMDLCSQLETMSLEKVWGKEKVSLYIFVTLDDCCNISCALEEGKRSFRSAQYASNRRRPRSHHVRLGRLDLSCK
jgi:hypothetical protein